MAKRRKTVELTENLFLDQKTWNTNGIFSEHYIGKKLLDHTDIWPDKIYLERAYSQLSSLWKKRYVGLKNGNEETARQEFINKVFDILGFCYFSNLDLPEQEKRKVPDYILFEDEKIKDEVFNLDLLHKYQSAIALAEAKKIDYPLDAPSPDISGKFPHQQVRDYLSYASDSNGTPFFRWAILTNGNLWRLYCRDSRPSSYFEFRLCMLDGNFCSFKDFELFVILFRPSNFFQQDGRCFLDDIRNEAISFQDQLEENLRSRVFAVIEDLANGFWSYEENNIAEEDLTLLYNNCLIFLYRLLFILYAEGRGLLPINTFGGRLNKNYFTRYSLKRLNNRLINHTNYNSDDLTDLYEELLRLFNLINGSNPKLNSACDVPRYNGGLFNPQNYPHINQWRIGEKSLSKVLRDLIFTEGHLEDRLSFTPTTIDYSELEVRQIGDIYEGLLGSYLKLEGEKLFLFNEKGELHNTGTFYTPDWVVLFLIEKSLLPLIRNIELNTKVSRAVELGLKDDSFAKEILKLNLLDCAMGSGHFLTRATEWLADEIVYHPTTLYKTSIAYEGFTHEQNEISYWRRRVVESCIYGVDINPMAVELTKLSLWLTCIAVNQPLNFLDHHIRTGNSLVATEIEKLRSHPMFINNDQYALTLGDDFSNTIADSIAKIVYIEGSESSSIDEIKLKEAQWREGIVKNLLPFKKVADLWISISAGLPISEPDYYRIANYFLKRYKKQEVNELKKVFESYEINLSSSLSTLLPFHWELEFPEVFYNENGLRKDNPGFDAIVGNPPYISTQTSSELHTRNFIEKDFGFIDDLYVHFIYRSLSLLRNNGILGYIVSDTFLTLTTKIELRKIIQCRELIYLGQCNPFKATVDAALLVMKNSQAETDYYFKFIQARFKINKNTPEKDLLVYSKKETNVEMTNGDTYFETMAKRFITKHGLLGCLRIHETSIIPYKESIRNCFFEPTERNIKLYNTINLSLVKLVDQWWSKIDSSKKVDENKAKIMKYHSNLCPGAVTLLGLISEGGQGMRTGDNGRYIAFLENSPQSEKILARRKELVKYWKQVRNISTVFLKYMDEFDNDIELVIDKLREKFTNRDLALKRGEIYKIVNKDNLYTPEEMRDCFESRKTQLEKLWNNSKAFSGYYHQLKKEYKNDFVSIFKALYELAKSKNIQMNKLGVRNGEYYLNDLHKERIATIHNGITTKKCWLPFRKGDPDGNKWTDLEPLYINWSSKCVKELNSAPTARWQGFNYFLTPGVTYTALGNHAALKAKLQPECIFDASASRLTPFYQNISVYTFLAVLNSNVFSYIIKKFINNTAAFEVNDLRMAPFVIPDEYQTKELDKLGEKAVHAKELVLKKELPSNELIDFCKGIYMDLENAPEYLRLTQLSLIERSIDCLNIIESKINWEVEKLFDVEGCGPYKEF